MRPTGKDLKLLFELGENARKPHSRIGKRIRISQQMVSYKIKSYLENGLITQFYPLIDYSRCGFLSFRVYFKTNYISREKFLSLLEKLSKEPGIVEIIECGGRHDVILTFSARNPSSFNKTIKEIIFNHPQLKNHTIITAVVGHIFPRNYLVRTANKAKDIILGGDREPIPIDDIDRAILSHLQENAITPSLEIASRMHLNPKTVISRIKKLEARKIIKGYAPLFHLQTINYKTNKILLNYHNLSPEKEEELRVFCMRNPHITEFIKLIGEWDAEITVESKRMEEFRTVYSQVRERFEEIIQNSESFPIFSTHKKHSLPREFFT